MFEYQLTVGLFDKDTQTQKIDTNAARHIIADTLINNYNVYAFTMIDCNGVYKMASTGNIVHEPSIRIEIASDDDITNGIKSAINDLKVKLNQESIMFKLLTSEIEFI